MTSQLILPDRELSEAILALRPTAYWPMNDQGGAIADKAGGGWHATLTGTPTFNVAAPEPIGRGVTFSGTGQYATTAAGVPTPASSISVLAFISHTNAAGTSRIIAARHATSQESWRLLVGASEYTSFTVFQSGGAAHATQASPLAVNTGAWFLVAGTFDGVTLNVYAGRPLGLMSGSSTTLTGSWVKNSTAPVGIAHQNTAGLFPGTIAHVAYWADRVLTAGDIAYLNRLARGAA